MVFFTVGITRNKKNLERQTAVALADTFKHDQNHAKHIVCLNSTRFSRIRQSAHRFANKLNQHIELQGLDKSTFTDLYLVGSNIGLRRGGRHSQAQQIADALYKLGFINIRVHAFANQQSANEIKVTVKDDAATVVSKSIKYKSKSESSMTTISPHQIKQTLDWEENTFWPSAVKHVCDKRKSHAITLLNLAIAELKDNPAKINKKTQLEILQNAIKSHKVTWNDAQERLRYAGISVTDVDSIDEPVLQIRNQIDKHIDTLRKEQQQNKFKLFSGHIGSYKLKAFMELREIISDLYSIEEIHREIIWSCKSNSLLTYGKNKSSRSTTLIANILQGHPELGTTGNATLTEQDLNLDSSKYYGPVSFDPSAPIVMDLRGMI